MYSGCIVNNGIVYIAYHFEPDWDTEDISEEDCAEPVQARLLIVYFFCLLLSHILEMLLFVNSPAFVSF